MAKKSKKPIVTPGKPASPTPASGPAPTVPGTGSGTPPSEPPASLRHFFTPEDWIAAIATFLISGASFLYTMSPEVTMEDSGELVTGAFNFGVPHPPGYPLWAFMGWMWRHLVPIGNPAWRICLLSVLTGALVVGVLTLLMTRSLLMLLRSVSWTDEIEERMKHWIALTVGASMALLFGFNRGVWLWACVPEIRVLNVFMFVLTSCLFFAWMMRPERFAFLYATMLVYALGISNHQTIFVMVAPIMVGAFAVGLLSVWNLGEPLPSLQQVMAALHAFWELLVAALFGWSIGSFVYAWLQAADIGHTLGQNIKVPMFLLFGSAQDATLLVFAPAGAAVLLLIWFGAEKWLSPRRALICTAAVLIGCSFYVYMPVSAATNPPMNWGFTATKQGFLHEITRGQYEKLNLASPLSRNFYIQILLFAKALMHQYSSPLCLLGFVTLVMLVWRWKEIGSRGRSWLIFVWAAFFTTSFGLLTIINPGLDKQNQEINLKFFAPAHGFFAMLIGYGAALLIAAALVRVKREAERSTNLMGISALGAEMGLFAFVAWVVKSQLNEGKIEPGCAYGLWVLIAVVAAGALLATAMAYFTRSFQLQVRSACVTLFLLPIIPFVRNWYNCEQRNHDFGYQFGYRMFYPGGEYPPMEPDAVLFGGTDPGRFVPTYMIFGESRVDPKDRYHDPHLDPEGGANFDRRDVYIITQNALADNTYMSYIRDHYDFSRPSVTNDATLAKFVPWQRAMFRWGWTNLHRDSMYPRDPIYIPTEGDLQKAFQEYVENVRERQKRGEQIGSGEQVNVDDAGRVSVRGVEGVMNINGILTKWIFDRNKDKHAFYVEESYVIPWMFDYLTPAGAIMKINRDPTPPPQQSPEFWAQVVSRDTAYWDKLTADFKARPEFHRDSDAQKTFSKLRSAIGGLYANRHLTAQAEYAFRQARDLCPESPEANFRLAQLYMELNRLDDAVGVLQDLQKLDPLNQKITDAINQLQAAKQTRNGLQQLEQARANAPRDVNLLLQLANAYFKLGQRDRIIPLCDGYLDQPGIGASDMMQIAQIYVSLNQADHSMAALQKILAKYPQEAQAYYAIALIDSVGNKVNEALDALGKAIELNPSFRDKARNDPQFGAVRNDPRFQKLVGP